MIKKLLTSLPGQNKRSDSKIGEEQVVEIYSKPDCHLCDEAKERLKTLQSQYGFELKEVDISRDRTLLEKYGTRIPLVWVNGHLACKYHIDEKILVERLRKFERAKTESKARV